MAMKAPPLVSQANNAATWLVIDCWAMGHRMRQCGLDSEATRLWHAPLGERAAVLGQPHVVLTLLLNGYDPRVLLERLRRA